MFSPLRRWGSRKWEEFRDIFRGPHLVYYGSTIIGVVIRKLPRRCRKCGNWRHGMWLIKIEGPWLSQRTYVCLKCAETARDVREFLDDSGY